MKSFRQFNEYTANATLKQAEDETHAAFNVQDPIALQKLNAYVGSIADREYLQPDAAPPALRCPMSQRFSFYAKPKRVTKEFQSGLVRPSNETHLGVAAVPSSQTSGFQ